MLIKSLGDSCIGKQRQLLKNAGRIPAGGEGNTFKSVFLWSDETNEEKEQIVSRLFVNWFRIYLHYAFIFVLE